MRALLGPVMLGIDNAHLTPEEQDLLQHPAVGGVILFSRNYQNPQQLAALIAMIRQHRPLRVAVDHEGGRVQRFRKGFSHLPPMSRLGIQWQRDPQRAKAMAEQCGWLLASELRAVGVDFSFTPVLDINHGQSQVIGDRALADHPDVVVALANSLISGLRQGGMAAVGKHFPGHGSVTGDSHKELPVDSRSYQQLQQDMEPFAQVLSTDLAAIMPAHVIYSAVDEQPAGFSVQWLKQILRNQLGFKGAIISDDLDMAGAAWAGSPAQRAQRALQAGCNIVLACNCRPSALAIIEALEDKPIPQDLANHWQILAGQTVKQKDRDECLYTVQQLWQQH